MARTILILGLLLALTPVWAQEVPPLPQPVKEGNLERLVLDDGLDRDAAAWVPAEANVAVDKQHARRGDSALRLHIEVNWQTGEVNYPVGWPRMNRKFPVGLHDWTGWDYLEFSIYTTSSRTALPTTPLGIGLYGAGNKADYNRTLSELKLGGWVDYRLPLSLLPGRNPRTAVQFFIAESNYKHGDVLDFWIDNLSLVRYCEPTLTASRLAEGAVFADAAYLRVDVEVMGVRPGDKTEITWQLVRSGKALAQGKLEAGPGKVAAALPLPAKGLAPGEYELVLLGKGDNPPPMKVVVVPSPWQEGSK